MREALRMMEDRDEAYQKKLAELRKQVKVGLDQIERGETVDGEAALEQILGRGKRKAG